MAVLAMAAVLLSIFIPIPERFRSKSKDPSQVVITPPTDDLAPEAIRVELPEFKLTERNGQEVSRESLKGKVWIAAFVFTRCTMGCPSVTASMKQLQTELKLADRDDLRLVTFTVDPERDNLDDLKKYAKTFQANETKWLFLTGEETAVRPLLKSGFKVTADRKAPGQAKPGDEFDHTTKLAVVDKKGRICGYFDGKASERDPNGEQLQRSLTRLKALVDQLVNEP